MSPGKVTDFLTDRMLEGGGKGDPPPPLQILDKDGNLALSPTYICGQLNFVLDLLATGGTPGKGYIWTINKGLLTIYGDRNSRAKFVHSNPNPGVLGTAYATYECTNAICPPGQSGFSVINHRFKCDDSLIVAGDGNCGCGVGCFPSGQSCANPGGACNPLSCQLCGVPPLENFSPAEMPITKDCRTQEMINNGCIPCVVGIAGTIVTVMDERGRAVSVMLLAD